jgi:hypothetical protein
MKSKVQSNPFQTDRWEDETDHLFWLPSLFDELEKNRCVYLIGTRGSGKTTMLKSLDWKERLSNKSLQYQIKLIRGEDLFSKKYIGIYLDVGKKYIISHFYKWLENQGYSADQINFERGRLFSLYIEYMALYNLIEAVEVLREDGFFKYTPDDELKAIKKLLKIRPEIKDFIQDYSVNTQLDDVKLAIKKIYEQIWNESDFQSHDSPPVRFLSAHQIGSVLAELSKPILDLCGSSEEKYVVKVCIDSIESLDPSLIRALNTLIASKEVHTTFVFASTHEYIDKETTFITNHPLTKDDRDVHSLDNFYKNEKNFLKFIEEVTRLRFERELKHMDLDINFKKILGDYPINSLIDYELNKSISPKHKEFIKYTNGDFLKQWNALNKSFKKKPSEELKESNLYVQAFITKIRRIDLKKYFGKPNEFSLIQKTEFDKKVVGALLCLLYDKKGSSRLRIPYAGYKMIIQMSDSNIRDFLRQMKFIYQKSSFKQESFLENQIPIEVQKEGIYQASSAKYDEIVRGSSFAIEIRNMIKFLGTITHILQTNCPDALENPEIGTYIIDYSKLPTQKDRETLQKIIFTASVNKYYIKVIYEDINPRDKNIVLQKIRLHKLFAPFFIFSYRSIGGPRYEFEIPPDDLLNICINPISEKNQEKIIDRILKRLKRKKGNQSTLSKWT